MATGYFAVETGDGNELCNGLAPEIAHQAAQNHANRLGESVYLYEVGSDDEPEEIEPEEPPPADPVLVETMPGHLRDSHRAANNWGVYPHNGAERQIMARADAEAMLADGDDYDHIVRDATAADLKRYEIA